MLVKKEVERYRPTPFLYKIGPFFFNYNTKYLGAQEKGDRESFLRGGFIISYMNL